MVLPLLLAAAVRAQSPDDFGRKLYPVLEKAQCRLCHNDNGVASRTRLHFPPEDVSPDEISRVRLAARRPGGPGASGESLLFRKPTNRLQHTGGERIHPGSEEEKILRAWIGYLATLPEDARHCRGHARPPNRSLA